MSINSWHEFTITCPGELDEAVTAALFRLGCTGSSEEPDGTLRAYFPGDADTETITAALHALGGLTCTLTRIEDQDWYAGWKAGIGPYRVAGLLICPPWKQTECAPGDGERLILLDPGQAFGTGEHESTTMVLGMLRDWTAGQGDPATKRLLDLGTGTGILSIAAYVYGVREITAVDVEQKAVETAGRNLALNGLTGKIRLMKGSVREAASGYDIILANLFQELLVELMPDIAAALSPSGTVVLSGLLTGQETLVLEAASGYGLELDEREELGGWVCLRLNAQAREGLR